MNQTPKQIQPNDIISGATYLKLINDYQQYDKKQKDFIYSLKKRIELLEWVNQDLQLVLDEIESGEIKRLVSKIENQREQLAINARNITLYKSKIWKIQ